MSHRGRRPLRRRSVALGLVLAGLASLLAGCGSHAAAKPPPVTYLPGTGGTVTVGIDQEPTGCNPSTATGDTFANRLVLSTVLPSAFTVDQQGQSQYDQALIEQAETVSTQPQTVVYTLNPKAVWSDGTPITAADFMYAWDHQRLVPLDATGEDVDVASTAGYDDIQSIKPSNDGHTLTVVFSTPYADWQGLFSDLVPAHVFQRIGWSPGCTTVDPNVDLSGGPYEIHAATRQVVTLVRNPRWWGPKPKIARLVIRVADGPSQLAQWLQTGVIDVAAPTYFDPGFLENVSAGRFLKSSVGVSNTFLQLEFSTVGTLTSDQFVRQGIAFAVDRRELTNRVAAWADVDIAPASSHLYSQSQAAYPNNPAPVPANSTSTTTTTTTTPSPPISALNFPNGADPVESAENLLAAGYVRSAAGTWVDAAGHPLTVRLAVDAGDGWAEQAALVLVDQLKDQGIEVESTSYADLTSTGEALAGGRADLALLPLNTSPYTSRSGAWYTPTLDLPGGTGAQDWSGYQSTKLDGLFAQAAQELDPVTAQPLYSQIDRQLWSEMVALPLFAEPTVLAWSDFVTGITPGSYMLGLFFTEPSWARLVEEPASFTGTPQVPTTVPQSDPRGSEFPLN